MTWDLHVVLATLPRIVTYVYLAIVRPLCGIVIGISCTKGGMNGGETSTVINWWLIKEFEILGEVKESVDTLLL